MNESDFTVEQLLRLRRHWWNRLGAPGVGRARALVLPSVCGLIVFGTLAAIAIRAETSDPKSRLVVVALMLGAMTTSIWVFLRLVSGRTRLPFRQWLTSKTQSEIESLLASPDSVNKVS
jgi:hypothetical protein